ncbi:MaoC family dehydratase [Bosea sp. (in: a-proteobacteria)]|uniref:MaoC family dehydratase n=1 Tax=Bosea sp. (in: a-proteobacteria) TaxID=1871050 RepID=UPI0025C26719|nr:MaoC family dehydratase [Bosea sp. (in: a-proteobacteria)]MBR3194210.1 MaoC family dehydratase [Bosea sp. (in: a-proteobacteria)]
MLYFEDFVPGSVNEYGSLPVSQDDILAFAGRFDAQDFHIDPDKAKASFVGTLIGSGWHSCALLMRLAAEAFFLDSTSMGSPGVEEVKWLRPVKPGDTLRLRWTVAETKESRSRPEMGLVKFRFELLNQRGEPVVEQNNWVMFGRRGSGFEAARGDWLAHSASYEPPQLTTSVEAPTKPTASPRYFDELAIGDSYELGSLVFTPQEIVAFARSFDPQPFHMDEEAARKSSFGSLCASGWHTAAGWMAAMVSHRRRQEAMLAPSAAPRLGPSPGFKNLRWLKPVYAGDRITYHSAVADKRPSSSRPDWGLFFHHNTGVNQKGETVLSFEGCVFLERKR